MKSKLISLAPLCHKQTRGTRNKTWNHQHKCINISLNINNNKINRAQSSENTYRRECLDIGFCFCSPRPTTANLTAKTAAIFDLFPVIRQNTHDEHHFPHSSSFSSNPLYGMLKADTTSAKVVPRLKHLLHFCYSCSALCKSSPHL